MQNPNTTSFHDQNLSDNLVLSEESLCENEGNGEISNFDKNENQLSLISPFNDEDQVGNYVIDEECLSKNGENGEISEVEVKSDKDCIENQLGYILMEQPETTFCDQDQVENYELAEESLSRNGGNGEVSNVEAKIDGDLVEEEEEKIEPSSSRGWRDSCEGEEGDGPVSPSSSGYVGGGGSGCTSRTSGFIGGDESNHYIGINRNEVCEIDNAGGLVNGTLRSREGEWRPGKRHIDEDEASMSWRKRKKHYIVLSHSGKPIYSRYGDEHKLAGFSATLQAIISFIENGGDRLKLVSAGKHQVVFLVKGPIYLVCISCTEESYESLTGQLELLYDQMVLILTKSVNRCFAKNPKFDMTPLLGGTDTVFSSLIHSFSWNPATFLHAYTCLPLPYATRQAAGIVLQDVAKSGVLFAILMCRNKVISLVAEKESLHPDDMLLLSNFVTSSESFRTSESFSPICLPRFNAMAFIYAYVHYFDVDTYLMLLTTGSDNFYHLKDCRVRIETVLSKSNVLSEVKRSMLKDGMRVEDLPVDPSSPSTTLYPQLGHPRRDAESQESIREALVGIGGPGGLWHFMYHSIYLDQFVASEFSSPVHNLKQQKKLLRAYQKLYVSMHEKDGEPHKTRFRRDENYVLLCWVTEDFELYAAFDPLADKALAIKTCNLVCHWVKDVENEIFFTGASSFSWYNASGQSYLFAA